MQHKLHEKLVFPTSVFAMDSNGRLLSSLGMCAVLKRLSGGGCLVISILLKMQFARSWYVELYTRNSKRAPHFSKLMLRN